MYLKRTLHFLVIATTTSLFLTSTQMPAVAAPTAGTVCAKVGIKKIYQGKRYTCVKSGKKLVWSKGVILVQARPSPSPTPTINDSSSKIQKHIEVFRIEMNKWFSKTQQKSVPVEYFIDPSLDNRDFEWLKVALQKEADFLGQDTGLTYKIYIGLTDAWVIQKRKTVMPGLEGWNPEYICYENPVAAGCAQSSSREFFMVQKNPSFTNESNWIFTQAVGHEFFHLIQGDLFGADKPGPDFFGMMPAWFAEGAPQMVGTIFMDYAGVLTYEDVRASEISLYKNCCGPDFPLSAFDKNVLDLPHGQSLRPYGIGMLASQLIVENYGFENFLNVFRQLKITQNFDSAFKTALGISLKDFYNEFDSKRVEIGFFPVKK